MVDPTLMLQISQLFQLLLFLFHPDPRSAFVWFYFHARLNSQRFTLRKRIGTKTTTKWWRKTAMRAYDPFASKVIRCCSNPSFPSLPLTPPQIGASTPKTTTHPLEAAPFATIGIPKLLPCPSFLPSPSLFFFLILLSSSFLRFSPFLFSPHPFPQSLHFPVSFRPPPPSFPPSSTNIIADHCPPVLSLLPLPSSSPFQLVGKERNGQEGGGGMEDISATIANGRWEGGRGWRGEWDLLGGEGKKGHSGALVSENF